MKIVFSRKGVDATAGGFPSPIFPDGRLISIPIPSSKDNFRYGDLPYSYEGEHVSRIMQNLTGGFIHFGNKRISCDYRDQRCHFDPMLITNPEAIAFGQTGASESHLRKQGVGPGDIFVFYGYFREVEKTSGKWRYRRDAPDLHIAWCVMQVAEVLCMDDTNTIMEVTKKHPWLEKHPHLHGRSAPNSIYIGYRYRLLRFGDCTLTKPGCTRSIWLLPGCFSYPDAFTYFRPRREGTRTIIHTPGRGQEAVCNTSKITNYSDRKAINAWIETLFQPAETRDSLG